MTPAWATPVALAVRAAWRDNLPGFAALLAQQWLLALGAAYLGARIEQRSSAAGLLAVALGAGVLRVAGLARVLARRRRASDAWLRTLPVPASWWTLADLAAVALPALAPTLLLALLPSRLLVVPAAGLVAAVLVLAALCITLNYRLHEASLVPGLVVWLAWTIVTIVWIDHGGN